MSVPYYVSPEQIIADKAEFAEKGIRRGRSVVVICSDAGVLFVADNPSRALHKVGEIYDRIGFAAVGKYNEFESLRVAGVRLADMRGYSYDRADVTVRTIANAYAQTLGSIFIEAAKPYEVELAVAEVGDSPKNDQLYRISFDGSVHDQSQFICMGGESETISDKITNEISVDMSVNAAFSLAIRSMRPEVDASQLTDDLEVALLDRNRPRRTFVRYGSAELADMLN
jgi:proteasome alpha subunit